MIKEKKYIYVYCVESDVERRGNEERKTRGNEGERKMK